MEVLTNYLLECNCELDYYLLYIELHYNGLMTDWGLYIGLAFAVKVERNG